MRSTAAWQEFDLVIASMHTAKREPHRSAITARHWDLLIVDEAHHLRNRQTQLWRFASALQTQFTLLLTATPVQNNLEELFNLVTLLEPGLLRTARQFQKEFVDRRTLLQLAEQARGLRDNAKADRLLRLLEEYPDKIVVFTQFRATQDMLASRLQAARHDLVLFHGGLTRLAKEASITRFRGSARILLGADAGSEGRNLQFAHAIPCPVPRTKHGRTHTK